MSLYVAVDTGGTFTDLVVFDAAGGSVKYTKSLTTHDRPADGIMSCVDKVEVHLDGAELFKHGTTLVINTLLERSGPRIGLVMTRGFRDVMDFGRGNRTEPFNLFFRREDALASRECRLEIAERISATGEVLVSPDRDEVRRTAEELRALGVAAVGVSFINSYVEPKHERLVAGWLREFLPDIYVTTGTELTQEWYEYERTATAAANAYVGPKVGRYVDALEASLAERGFAGQFMMMGSNGGVLSRQHAAAAPIVLVESGPVGGCIGAGAYAAELGISNVIAFDMGGTTAKCALVQEGRFETDSIYYVGGYGRGIPVRVGVVDIVEVGTGGGSIASLDAQKRLLVGPKSAGSMPGPVAYGRGGAEPTVTDANLLLGRIGAESFQGGEMKLDLEGARAAMLHWLAEPLGYGEAGLDELASGVLSIATLQMGEAIKRITIQRGLDPANFTLFAYGGGGPLHSVELARQLRIPTVVVPPEAGNFSAIGMLLADIRRDQSATFLRPLDEATLAEMEQVFRTMQDELSAHILADFGELPVSTERAVEIRYVGQFHTVRMDVGEREAKTDLYRRFHETYKARYGHASQTAPAEIVSLHCTLVATTAKPDIAGLAGALPSQAPEPATLARRRIYLASTKDHAESVVYSRRSLPRGFKGSGPAVIEEYGSTTLLSPADTFEIGKLGEIRISVGQQAGPANG